MLGVVAVPAALLGCQTTPPRAATVAQGSPEATPRPGAATSENAVSAPHASETPTDASGLRRFSVFFPDTDHPDSAKSCAALSAAERYLPATDWSARAVVQMVLAGPTDAERADGLQDPYEASSSYPASTDRLGAFFEGAVIDGSIAVVTFRSPAMRWLNAAACQQAAVKTPIERTLREAFGVTAVRYSVGGRVIEEWDA